MMKTLILFAIASCFFLENIVVHIVIRNNTTYFVTEAGENDSSENESKKDQKEDYSISTHYKYFFISDILDNYFNFFTEKPYFEYCPEINLPPPDLG